MVIMVLLLSFMPNSPRFLLSRGRDAEALQALAWLRGADADIRWEFQQIQDNVQRQVREARVPSHPQPHSQPRCPQLCVAVAFLNLACFSWETGMPVLPPPDATA